MKWMTYLWPNTVQCSGNIAVKSGRNTDTVWACRDEVRKAKDQLELGLGEDIKGNKKRFHKEKGDKSAQPTVRLKGSLALKRRQRGSGKGKGGLGRTGRWNKAHQWLQALTLACPVPRILRGLLTTLPVNSTAEIPRWQAWCKSQAGWCSPSTSPRCNAEPRKHLFKLMAFYLRLLWVHWALSKGILPAEKTASLGLLRVSVSEAKLVPMHLSPVAWLHTPPNCSSSSGMEGRVFSRKKQQSVWEASLFMAGRPSIWKVCV